MLLIEDEKKTLKLEIIYHHTFYGETWLYNACVMLKKPQKKQKSPAKSVQVHTDASTLFILASPMVHYQSLSALLHCSSLAT